MDKLKGTGTVLSNPVPFKTRSGVMKAKVDVKIGDTKATYWSDDPFDAHLFSFAAGDEVNVEYWQRGDFWNCEITSPSGSVKNAEDVATEANAGYGKPVGDFDSVVEEMTTLYGNIRNAVIESQSIDVTLTEDMTPELKEEVYRQATASIFIEVNRRGLSRNEAFGE